MSKKIARIVSLILHPLLIPSFGLILLFHSGFYFSFLTWEAKRFILMILFFSTAVLPFLSIAIITFTSKAELKLSATTQRALSLIFSASFYYMGYILLNRINVFPIFKIFFISAILVIISILIFSIKWNISTHLAALGGVTGTILAFSLRTNINPVWALISLIIASGLSATSQLLLDRYNLWQLLTGYFIGFLIQFLIIYHI